jgi:hypothetical protein
MKQHRKMKNSREEDIENRGQEKSVILKNGYEKCH